jgi:hypothetical protein
MKHSKRLGDEIDEINIEFKNAYDRIESFFSRYYALLAIMALTSFFWFIYSFSMLIPSKNDDPALFSKPCGIVFLTLGASLFSVMGSVLFLKSQILISDCHRAVKLLDHPNMVQKLYGNEDREWARICLARGSSGDISMFLKEPEKIIEFIKPLSILKAFSSELSTLDHRVSDYDPPHLLNYSIAVEAFTKFELPDQIGKPNQGYAEALKLINTYTRHKAADRYVLNKKGCASHSIVVDTVEGYNNPPKDQKLSSHSRCIVLNKLNITELSP